MNRDHEHDKRPVARWRALLRDRRAATAVEYGLILALVVLTMLGALINLANTTTGMWNDISAKVTNAR